MGVANSKCPAGGKMRQLWQMLLVLARLDFDVQAGISMIISCQDRFLV